VPQTAKQVILQKVREAERDNVYNEFKDRKGDLVSGVVQRLERGNLYLTIVGPKPSCCERADSRGGLPPGGAAAGLHSRRAEECEGPQIFLSRTHPGFLTKLFEMEVPEIAEGIIKVISAARSPGESKDIGLQFGPGCGPGRSLRGDERISRQSVVQELRGERIDIIPWSQDTAKYVCNALAPAKISKVFIDEEAAIWRSSLQTSNSRWRSEKEVRTFA